MDQPSIIFFGNERLATGVTTSAAVLRALLASGYHVAAIVSHNEVTASRKQRTLEVAELAESHAIPILLPSEPAHVRDQLAAYQADIGVLVAYGKIMPPAIIKLFPHGIINVHPSLLPNHRGPTPIESVMLSDEQETGVSIMQLTEAMDEGPLYAQETVRLHGNESKQELADTLLELGSRLIVSVLPDILADKVQPVPQSSLRATYDERLAKEDGLLDFSKPAAQLVREVQAYLDWPTSRTTLQDKPITVTKAHMVSGQGEVGKIWHEGKEFGFYTTHDIFVIDSLKPAGKQEMSAQAFLAGYRLR